MLCFFFLFQFVSVYLREQMTVEEFLASACSRKGLNPMEHFVRVKKRRDMEDHNYFVPHRSDTIETYVSSVTNISTINHKMIHLTSYYFLLYELALIKDSALFKKISINNFQQDIKLL